MKKQYFINANIIDPLNSINEIGGLIINEEGKIEAALEWFDVGGVFDQVESQMNQ